MIITITCALFAVGIITGYLRGKQNNMKPASLLCNISYFALGAALLLFAFAGALRLSQISNSQPPKPQPFSYLKKLGDLGPFDSGFASLCDPKIVSQECEARLKAAFAPLGIAQLQHTPGFLILIGSADRERLTPPALRKYGSNAGLARGRSEWVQQELLKRFPQALGNAQFISIYTGPNPFENATHLKSDPDRRVEVWAGSVTAD